jgi:hypothetical protein
VILLGIAENGLGRLRRIARAGREAAVQMQIVIDAIFHGVFPFVRQDCGVAASPL